VAEPTRRATKVLDASDVERALKRIGYEIVERNRGDVNIVFVGIEHGGIWIAEALASHVSGVLGTRVNQVSLDVRAFRDDVGPRTRMIVPAHMGFAGTTVVLVDDVLQSGRTVRAGLDALSAQGRASKIELAVMIDRGQRELPIRPDFVGKNLPTRRDEFVRVGQDGVYIEGRGE